MRNILVAILVLVLSVSALIAPTYARLPAVGDHVRLWVGGGSVIILVEGTISDIGGGFLCLKDATAANGAVSFFLGSSTDYCVNIEWIQGLVWIK